MGTAFLVISLSIFAYFTFGIYDMLPKYRIALNISCYYIASKLIASSFLIVIGQKRLLRGVRKRLLVTLYAFPLITWATVFVDNAQLVFVVQSVMSVLLFICIINDIIFFFKQYREVVINGEYYYAEGIGVHISWVLRSVYAIVGIGVCSSTMALLSHRMPTWGLFIFLLCFIFVCMYIFNQLLHFTNIYSDMVDKSSNIDPLLEVDIRKSTLSEQMLEQIAQQVDLWIQSKEFCRNKMNIITAAQQLGSNRLYLSTYINTMHKCTFRSWVSRLRINEAKRLMVEKPQMTITQIAEEVGFVSLTSFTHAFKNVEGISPKEWAAENSAQVDLQNSSCS
ncbi:MAG: helix-turn-helix domain-containing protein [Rikenellaceae bacterium]